MNREPCEPCEPCSGFTLIEVLVACTIFIAVAVGVAHLFTAATAANAAARAVTYASILAMEKMEQLRALPIGDAAVAISPPDSLDIDAPGYSDTPLAGYWRRWKVARLPSQPDEAVAISVVVRRAGGPGDARLATIKVRKAG